MTARTLALAAVLAACAVLAATADQAHAQAATSLIRAVSDGQGHQHSVYARYSSSAGFVLVNAPSASTVTLTFAAMGQNVTVSQDRARTSDGLLVWTGSDSATGTTAILIVNGTEVFGTIDTAGRTYLINPLSPTVHELLELDDSKFPPFNYNTPAATAPGAPASLSAANATARSVALSWKAPSSDGGSAITDYLVYYKRASHVTWTGFADGVSSSVAATITGLDSGTAYNVIVAAQNSAGTGAYSSQLDVATRPSAPGGLAVTASNSSSVTLGWNAPPGDAAVTYAVQYQKPNASAWTTFASGINATSAKVTGLEARTGYDFRVAASTASGTGAHSGTVSGGTYTKPSAPLGLAASAHAVTSSSIPISWSQPSSDGGSKIKDYLVYYKKSSHVTWTGFADGVSSSVAATITGLDSGTTYNIIVAAQNGVGTGPYSNVATVTTK